MNRDQRRQAGMIFLFGVILGTISLIQSLGYQASDEIKDQPLVIVISVDGLRPDALLQVETPNIQALAQRGAYTWQASTIFPPGTLPSHASMLTGTSPEIHGVDWNSTIPGCPPIKPRTFLTVAAQAGFRTGMAVGKEKFCHFIQYGDMRYLVGYAGDRTVVDAARIMMTQGVDVLFVHFPNPDYFGHRNGWMSDSYMYELRNTDANIGRLLEGVGSETLIILTADHGGTEKSHKTRIPEHMLIPWIIAGGDVKSGLQLDVEVNIVDTAATVFWWLDLPVPENVTGRAVIEAFNAN